MITVERNQGRLIEAVMTSPVSLAEIDAMVQSVRLQVLAWPEPVVICALMVDLRVLQPGTDEPMLAMLKRDNPRLLRAGYLLASRSGSLAMQVARVAREAGNANRRVFDKPAELESYLGEVLTPGERVRLRAFLAANVAGAPPPQSG